MPLTKHVTRGAWIAELFEIFMWLIHVLVACRRTAMSCGLYLNSGAVCGTSKRSILIVVGLVEALCELARARAQTHLLGYSIWRAQQHRAMEGSIWRAHEPDMEPLEFLSFPSL